MIIKESAEFRKRFNVLQQDVISHRDFFALDEEVKIPLREPFRSQWIDALVSGVYNQGTDTLYQPETKSMCCLGVACDITHHTDSPVWVFSKLEDTWGTRQNKKSDVDCGTPSDRVLAKWFPDFTNDDTSPTQMFIGALIGLNDSKKFSFTDIAFVIDYCTVGV